MTLYDSSALIEYLDGDAKAVTYVENHFDERTVAPPIVLFEIYQGEIFKTGPADFAAVDRALAWLTIVDVTQQMARTAGELQNKLQAAGEPLAARDAFIAGIASALREHLVVADSDFAVEGITELVDVEFL